MLSEGKLEELRAAGWSVAVHNDYRLNGKPHTFWLFTHPNGRWVKGEGCSDDEALTQALAALRAQASVEFSGDEPSRARDSEGSFAALLRAATEALEWAEHLLSEEEDRTSPIVSQMPEMEALRAEIEKAAAGAVCRICLSEEWVCENHPHQPWREGGCLCGAGAPCPLCNHLATPSPAPVGGEVVEAAADLVNGFAWSCVRTDCDESRVYLQSLINRVRAALSPDPTEGGTGC